MNARRLPFLGLFAALAFIASLPAQGASCGCAIGEVSPTEVYVDVCDDKIPVNATAPLTCGGVGTGTASTNAVFPKVVGEQQPTSGNVTVVGTCSHGRPFSKPANVKFVYAGDDARVAASGGPGGGFGGSSAGNSSGWISSLHWQANLGKGSDGRLAGRLVLDSDEPDARIYTLDALSLVGLRLLDVVYEPFTNRLMQILAPECFVQMATAKSQTAYAIKFYTPDCLASEFATNVWYLYETAGASQVPISGDILLDVTTNLYYSLKSEAEPFVVYHIENPNPPSCNALRITESRNGGATSVRDYAWTGASWTLSDGGGLRTTQLAESVVGGNVVKTWSVSANGGISSTTRKTYAAIGGMNLPVQIVSDPDGEALTTTYDYYETGPSTGWLKKRTDADGSWTSHAYQSDNRESETRAGWLDGGSEDACRVTTRSYAPFLTTNDIPVGVPRDDGTTDPNTPRVETVTLAGVPVSKTLRTVALDTMGYRRIEEVRLLDPAETNLVAAWADPANPRTLSRYMPESDFKPCSKQPELIVRPDGTATHYAYIDGYCTNGVDGLPGDFEIVSGGPHFTTTITRGTCESFGLAPDGLATNGFNGVPGRTTREVVVATKTGKLELQRETYVCSSGGGPSAPGEYERVSWTTTTRDELGRVVATRSSDGTRTEKSWNGDLLAYEIGADGVRTDYTYDALGRVASATVSVAEGAGSPAPRVATTIYDAESRVLSSTVSAGGLSQTTTNRYDGAGRLVWTRSPDGLETAYDYGFTAAGLPYTSTIKSPSPLLCASAPLREALSTTNTVVRHKDGQIAYTEFNGVRKTTYAYGVNADGSQWTLSVQGDLPEAIASQLITYQSSLITELDFPWEMQLTDPLGRTIREERPGYDGAILVTENSYAPSGQLLSSTQSTIIGSVPSVLSVDLYSYDALGEAVVTARDIDLDGQINYAGPDVVSSNATQYVQIGGAWWRESRQYAFPDTGSAAALLVSTSRQRLSGLGGAYSADGASGVLVAESVSIDGRGNPSTSRTVVDRAAATVYQINQAPDSTVASLSVTVNGLRQSSRSTHNLTTTYAYDALGRMVSMQDARGGVYSRGYDEHGRVVWESDPATNGTWYAYDALGRQVAVTNALGHVIQTAYDAEDRVIATSGATYPVEYDYDDFGRMVAMRTFRDEEGAGDETRWLYEDATGVLTNKVYADGKGPSYTYTPDGKLASRTWARGSVASYAYDASGQLTGVDYSDTTPDIAYTYDRLGRQLSGVSSVSTNLFEYDGLDLVAETQNGVVITRATDSLGRSTGLSVAGVGDPSQPYSVTYGYDAYGRFAQVSNFQFQASYTYLGGTDLISGMTASSGHAWTRSYEPNRNLIAAVENTYGSTVISRFDYVNDEIGRRTAISRSGTAFDTPVSDTYGYNARSEVTSARRYNGATEVRGFSYDYAYDPIGNRTSATEYDHEDNALMSSYAANALNQYTQRTVPGYAGVRGSATNTATVTVNGNAAWRLDDYFYGGDAADNSLAAVMKELDVTAVVNPTGTNEADLVQSVTGRVFVAQSPEAFTHDDDGNLLSDGRFTYTWDGENRLLAVETRADLPTSVPRVKVSYAYDHQSRRIGKQSYALDGATWQPAAPQHYTYDGWNMIAETSGTNTTHYIWGLDLSGSRQGAGGVGGLLAIVQNGETYHSSFDANGNVGQLVNTNGALLAHYEYSPFGQIIVSTGPLAKTNPFRFSTKWFDHDTGLGYWGYRWYSPMLSRWLSRDPIGEKGGINLHAFCENDSVSKWDLLGMATRMGVPLFYTYNGFIYYAFQAIKTKGGCCEINVVQLFGKAGDKASDLKLDDTLEFDPDGKGEGKKLYYLNEYEMNDVTMLSEKYLQQLGFDPMISYVFADKPGSMNGNWDVGTLIGYLIPVEICWYNEGKTIEFLGIGKYIKRGRQYSYGLMSTPYEKQQIEEFLQKHFGPENGFVKAVGK